MKWYSTPSPNLSPYIFLGLDPSPPPLLAGHICECNSRWILRMSTSCYIARSSRYTGCLSLWGASRRPSIERATFARCNSRWIFRMSTLWLCCVAHSHVTQRYSAVLVLYSAVMQRCSVLLSSELTFWERLPARIDRQVARRRHDM